MNMLSYIENTNTYKYIMKMSLSLCGYTFLNYNKKTKSIYRNLYCFRFVVLLYGLRKVG